ncbi:MAG: ATP-binding protein [Candidatus Calescibacterium sp.]|nr:ATP-binding protein [Candidatus Calescibacterium sp.]
MIYLLERKYRDVVYINFEDIVFRKMKPEEFFEVIKIFVEVKGFSPRTLLLDEVQVVEDWQRLLRSLLERGYKIFITGSSSKLLGRELATELRGRTISYFLFPFSFREFLIAKNFEIKDHYTMEETGKILGLLKTYLTESGYPEVIFSEEKQRLIRSYFDEIFLHDFVERHKIRSIDFGKFLFEYFFQNFSKEVSINKIKNYLRTNIGFSDTTIYEYVEKLQDTLAVFFIDRFSKSFYQRRSWPKKVYIVDGGISSILKFSEDIGKLMENCVFIELMRRKNKRPFEEVFYLKINDSEIDFIVKEGNYISEIIEVTYDRVEQKKIRNIARAMEILNCASSKIITWDYEDQIVFNNK